MTVTDTFVDTCFQPHMRGGLCRYSCDKWWVNRHGIVMGRCLNHIPTQPELRDWKELSEEEVEVYRIMET